MGPPSTTLNSFTDFLMTFSCRKLLYNLSEEITDDDLKQVKFLLAKMLPRRKLEENVVSASSEMFETHKLDVV